MKTKENIDELLVHFASKSASPLEFNRSSIESDYGRQDEKDGSIAIKVLSILGGVFANLIFLFFIFVSKLDNSQLAMLILGGSFIAVAIFISKKFDKTILDTISISAYLIGFLLLGIGLARYTSSDNTLPVTYLIIAGFTLCIARNYMLAFLSILLINGSVIALILSNNVDYLLIAYASAHAISLAYFISNEARIIASFKFLSVLYNPVRIGLLFSFVSVLVFLGKKGLAHVSANDVWIASVVFIAAIIYLETSVVKVLGVKAQKQKWMVYFFSGAILLTTLFSPSISGAVLILLLSFYVNYKTGIALGIISLIYFISQYYYDLSFTLLTKSILLFVSGILFLLIYFFIHKKLHAK
jgi:uncharacterized membrane protein